MIIIIVFTIFFSGMVQANQCEYTDHKGKEHFFSICPSIYKQYDGGKINHPIKKSIRHTSKYNGKVIWDVIYKFDRFGRRSCLDGNATGKKFIIFSGGSYVFGEGLDSKNTLPCQFAHSNSDYVVYNYAVSGSGPQTMLDLLLSDRIEREVRQSRGHFIFGYLYFHLQRANGFMNELSWLKSSSVYEFNGENGPRRLGTFKDRFPIRLWWYELISKIPIINNKNYPSIKPFHVEYTCKLINAAKGVFLSKFPGSHFSLLIYHDWKIQPDLLRCFRERNINLIVLPFRVGESDYIERDGHPNAAMNLKVSRFLSAIIQE